jgi:N-acetylglutamate synthase-like GNAT family acetyltransferase
VIKKSDINIKLLQESPEHFAQVAAWHHQECERQGLQSTIATRQQRLLTHVQRNSIPKTLIALQGKKILGCVSLVTYNYRTNNMVSTTNPSPLWLSNLFVVQEWRQQGLGNLLIEAAKKYAVDFGVTELWLSAAEFTDYYQKRGWAIIRKTRLGGRLVNVMRLNLKGSERKLVVNA